MKSLLYFFSNVLEMLKQYEVVLQPIVALSEQEQGFTGTSYTFTVPVWIMCTYKDQLYLYGSCVHTKINCTCMDHV